MSAGYRKKCSRDFRESTLFFFNNPAQLERAGVDAVPLFTRNFAGIAFNTLLLFKVESVLCLHVLFLFPFTDFDQRLLGHLRIEFIEYFRIGIV